jgi:hypothetical protein
MKKSLLLLSGLLVLLLVLAGCASTNRSSGEPEVELTTFKTATCGCCGIWTKYADQNGYDVQEVTLSSVDAKKTELGVPRDLASCHTSVVEGYVVEGHVPVEAIDKLLLEKPDIKGIALPGMPSGTPGMPGPKTEDWTIYALHNDGSRSIFMVI